MSGWLRWLLCCHLLWFWQWVLATLLTPPKASFIHSLCALGDCRSSLRRLRVWIDGVGSATGLFVDFGDWVPTLFGGRGRGETLGSLRCAGLDTWARRADVRSGLVCWEYPGLYPDSGAVEERP